MIAGLISTFVRSAVGRYILLGVAILAGVKAWGVVKTSEGRRAEQARQSVTTIKSMRRSQDAGAAVHTDRKSIADRLRAGRF